MWHEVATMRSGIVYLANALCHKHVSPNKVRYFTSLGVFNLFGELSGMTARGLKWRTVSGLQRDTFSENLQGGPILAND
jgi:hypothetical protein